jgi:hypothetical protein
MSDLSMYEIPLSSCVNESNRNINDANFVRKWFGGSKSWKYRTPYCWKDGGQIKSNKKFSSIIKATRSMISRLNIVNILDSLNCCNSGLYVWV